MYETTNFKHEADQLGCHCCGEYGASVAILILMEMVREHFGAPVVINSCARCTKNNRKVGGSKNSEHRCHEEDPYSDAVDFRVVGVADHYVVSYLKKLPFANLLGIGVYKGRTHVDVRGFGARWVVK